MASNPSYSKCVEACQACATECLANVVAMLGKQSNNACPKCCLECAKVCGLCVEAMTIDAKFSSDYCRLCVQVCNWCADECAAHDHDHCQKCAEACRRCAEACQSVAA